MVLAVPRSMPISREKNPNNQLRGLNANSGSLVVRSGCAQAIKGRLFKTLPYTSGGIIPEHDPAKNSGIIAPPYPSNFHRQGVWGASCGLRPQLAPQYTSSLVTGRGHSGISS